MLGHLSWGWLLVCPQSSCPSLNNFKILKKLKLTNVGTSHARLGSSCTLSKSATAIRQRFETSWECLYETSLKTQTFVLRTGLHKAEEERSVCESLRVSQCHLEHHEKVEWCSTIHLPAVARSLWHPGRQREMKRGCGSHWHCTLSVERLGLSSSCVGTAFWMQTIWLQNVGQARKAACTAKLWLKKLSTNFPWRGFRSFDVSERESICMTVNILLSVRMEKDKSGLVQLGCYFWSFGHNSYHLL